MLKKRFILEICLEEIDNINGVRIILENNLNLQLDQIYSIIEEREKYIPKELYHYRVISKDENIKCNKHVDALKNEKIYLSNPYDFNDPYDSAFSINIEKFKENIKKILKQKLKEQIIDNKIREACVDPNCVNNKEIMYKDINIDMGIMDGFLDENQQFFYDNYVKNRIKFKVSCLSEIPDSILMWSHYANHHQGFCIGYDTSEIEEKIKKQLFPVFYHETFFPLINIDITDKKLNLLIKYGDWRYEREWRLISDNKFLPLKPSKIYLGVKFNEENLDYFKDIAREKNCKLYRMEMNYSEYALKAKEINL